MKRFFEKTKKGNPNRFTLNQHILPRRLIDQFAVNGLVEVLRLKTKYIFPVKPRDNIFTVKRLWDQRAESGWMKQIEDEFHLHLGVFFKNHEKIGPSLFRVGNSDPGYGLRGKATA